MFHYNISNVVKSCSSAKLAIFRRAEAQSNLGRKIDFPNHDRAVDLFSSLDLAELEPLLKTASFIDEWGVSVKPRAIHERCAFGLYGAFGRKFGSM